MQLDMPYAMHIPYIGLYDAFDCYTQVYLTRLYDLNTTAKCN